MQVKTALLNGARFLCTPLGLTPHNPWPHHNQDMMVLYNERGLHEESHARPSSLEGGVAVHVDGPLQDPQKKVGPATSVSLVL